MEVTNSKTWIEKLNQINTKLLMPAMAGCFILYNTVINLWIGGKLETIQNALAILILGIVACNILANPRENLKPWFKNNAIVMLYFVARVISLWQSGFDYSVIRTIFFEVFFLIGICTLSLKGGNNNFYIKLFMWIELIVSSLSLLLYYASNYIGGTLLEVLTKHTYYENSGNALLYSNPNTAGIMAGFSIILALILYGKKNYNKYFVLFFGAFNIGALVLFGCRSSEVGILAVVAALTLSKVASNLKKIKVIIIVLLLAIATLVPIHGLISYYSNQDEFSYSSVEAKIDSLSTGRYLIWKECVITQKDNLIFGAGSLKMEQQARTKLVEDLEEADYWRYIHASDLGPHNGYIGMISGTGWIGFALFIAILLQRIKRAKHLEKGNWYLMLIFIFVINCFESLFILNRFFTCFYMFLILEVDLDSEGENVKELPEEVIT